MNNIFFASYESRNFSFSAIGLTRDSAIDAILKGLKKHGYKLNLNSDWFDAEDINVIDYKIGIAYRDYSEI